MDANYWRRWLFGDHGSSSVQNLRYRIIYHCLRLLSDSPLLLVD